MSDSETIPKPVLPEGIKDETPQVEIDQNPFTKVEIENPFEKAALSSIDSNDDNFDDPTESNLGENPLDDEQNETLPETTIPIKDSSGK